MNCDNVLEMLVMLADGRIVRAAPDSNPDLFWAMRGGTGNNFGILLPGDLPTAKSASLWGFGLEWAIDKGASRNGLACRPTTCEAALPPNLATHGRAALAFGPRPAALDPVLAMRGNCLQGLGSRRARRP